MPEYLSPGVFVEEIPSAVQAIAGVSTSTAGFLGLVPDTVQIAQPNPKFDPTKRAAAPPAMPGGAGTPDASAKQPAVAGAGGGRAPKQVTGNAGGDDAAATGDDAAKAAQPLTAGTDDVSSPYIFKAFTVLAEQGVPKLVTNFAEFRRLFGGFSNDNGHNLLVHAVFGFFNNGGSRCYVARMKSTAETDDVLKKFEAIDEVAIIAAPGITDSTVRASLVAHCEATGNRFAIFDTDVNLDPAGAKDAMPPNSKNAAVYYPWLQVFDPGLKTREPEGKGLVYVPPSGHMAGIYARVDNLRGVFKAPGNEVVLGAVGLRQPISRAQQDGLNPSGLNCIRALNGNIRVWGARTVGGDANGEWKYINVRRTFLYLRKSIDEGTQWVVFEPNDLSLWAKITRNVSAFLTNVWHDGALFGASAAEAFYVKCDRETNPPEVRELGRVVTEIGVAIVRPAEFVIFKVSQWTGPEAK